MGSAIANVRANASSLLGSLSGLGDVAFGVGEYKDYPIDPYGWTGDFDYLLNQSITADTSDVQAGINNWGASGGADGPESQLSALKKIADQTETGWRDGSARFLVWFGDIYGHDSASEPAYPGPTEAEATAALVGKGIRVEAINTPGGILDGTGQATRIADATGGHYYSTFSGGDLVSTIEAALESAFASYTSVGLDLSEVPAGLSASATPVSHVGTYTREVDRSFDFELTFTADAPGTYNFNVYGTVDGGRVATERDSIKVPGGPTPMPDLGSTLALLGLSMSGLALARRSRR